MLLLMSSDGRRCHVGNRRASSWHILLRESRHSCTFSFFFFKEKEILFFLSFFPFVLFLGLFLFVPFTNACTAFVSETKQKKSLFLYFYFTLLLLFVSSLSLAAAGRPWQCTLSEVVHHTMNDADSETRKVLCVGDEARFFLSFARD
uniref:Transmembrane protein n=1 Tax=Trypanosoma congolense (strain IL3000) TaxID=1068625 RepID=G0ULA3_TRYCI|nr:hypothetical protein, unlikely [Trypanosoma congolense IL3000]